MSFKSVPQGAFDQRRFNKTVGDWKEGIEEWKNGKDEGLGGNEIFSLLFLVLFRFYDVL